MASVEWSYGSEASVGCLTSVGCVESAADQPFLLALDLVGDGTKRKTSGDDEMFEGGQRNLVKGGWS